MGSDGISIYSKRKQEKYPDIRANGYKGNQRWFVIRDGYGAAHVFAPDAAAAIWAAAKHWGLDPRKREIHQGITARRC